jgi:hypothetical protein
LVLKRTDFNAIENNPEITKQRNEHWQTRSRMNVGTPLTPQIYWCVLLKVLALYSWRHGILDVKFMSIQKTSMSATLYCHYD